MERYSILFVCLGNICRSPTAEGMFRHKVTGRGVIDQFEIDSAGVGDWHIGNPPDQRAQAAAFARGIDLAGQRARQIQPGDFQRFDYVIAMDHDNRQALQRMAGEKYQRKVRMMLEFSGFTDLEEVPDPYYGGGQWF